MKAEAVHRAELARLKREQEADERRWKEEQAPWHCCGMPRLIEWAAQTCRRHARPNRLRRLGLSRSQSRLCGLSRDRPLRQVKKHAEFMGAYEEEARRQEDRALEEWAIEQAPPGPSRSHSPSPSHRPTPVLSVGIAQPPSLAL